MALSFTGHNRNNGDDGESGVPLAPLIDIIFILLIFFLVTATFNEPEGMNVERPGARTSDSLPDESTVIRINDRGQMTIEGRPVQMNHLPGRLRSEIPRPSEASVVIAADRAVSTDTLVSVMDEARSAGIRDISIATREPE